MKTKTLKMAITLLFTSTAVICFSQDTLVMKNGTVLLTKILELSPTEIKYKKVDNLDGPTYVENKWNVSKIKYRNGVVETIDVAIPNDKGRRPSFDPDPDKIVAKGMKLFYHDKSLSKLELVEWANAKNNADLKLLVKERNEAKKKYAQTLIIALPTLAGAAAISFFGVFIAESDPNFRAMPLVGLGGIAASVTTLFMNKYYANKLEDLNHKIAKADSEIP